MQIKRYIYLNINLNFDIFNRIIDFIRKHFLISFCDYILSFLMRYQLFAKYIPKQLCVFFSIKKNAYPEVNSNTIRDITTVTLYSSITVEVALIVNL